MSQDEEVLCHRMACRTVTASLLLLLLVKLICCQTDLIPTQLMMMTLLLQQLTSDGSLFNIKPRVFVVHCAVTLDQTVTH